MGIAAGTVLARSKREGWTQQIAQAKLIERPELARDLAKSDAINAITPMQSAAITMQDRAARHVERMTGITDRVLPHLESMEPAEILDSAYNLGGLRLRGTVQLRIGASAASGRPVNLPILTNRSLIQIISSESQG
jgi:hypothetical protein